ncbi:MAG: lysine--tRNA ligase [Duodenibacillus sp.]|nr:lysine--tRNA ligase [Duodenibacillus sp.]
MSENTNDKDVQAQQPEDENHIFAERRAKLAALRAAGVAYPNDFVRKDLFGDLRERWGEATAEELEAAAPAVAVSGRLMLKRIMGKASFGTVHDFTGDMQYFVSAQEVGPEQYAFFKTLDLGDIVAAEGVLFRTKRGELSVRVSKLRLLTKNLRPLPDKHKGLTDPEACCRQRYTDLIINEESRRRFTVRSKAVSAIRRFMEEHRFMEVETPMLNLIPGGANAKPFITHHNALDVDQYLRVAPELYLKRLVVGGFERVFELNRCFRNEGIDTRHNPEFTTIEFYCTYWTYRDQMEFTERLLRHVAREAAGSDVLTYQGQTIDLSKPFDRLTPEQAIMKHAPGYTAGQLADEAFLREELKRLRAPQPDWVGKGALVMALFEEVAESKLISPTFIIDYPVEISPLARASDERPGLTERFELFIFGRETANGFSELNDPEDQARRFQAQADAKSHGDDEAMYYDADFIRALEYGLPPTAGCGIGIDRFVMLLTDASSIREVLLFPTLRPESECSGSKQDA